MATYTLFGFHCFLLSCFMLAAAYDEKCPQPQPCGHLGEIHFPFTTSSNPKCGIQIRGCESHSADKEIKLTHQNWYRIDSIFIRPLFYSIFIHYPDLDVIFAPEPLEKPFKIISNITFFRCIRKSSDESTNDIPPMPLYRNCPYFDIYFNSSFEQPPSLPLPMPVLPFACLLFQFLPFGPVPICPSYTFVFSLLQIKLELPQSCNECYPFCQFKPGDPNFSCVPPNILPEPPSGAATSPGHARSQKATIIGLSVGIPGLVVLVIFWLCKRRKKNSGLQNKSRSACSGSFRNTTTRESGVVCFEIPVFSYEELEEATNNFDQARELGEGGFGTVYFGKLGDGREVAVKRLFERNYRPVESFINEIKILTRLRHRNLVSLYGCTSRHSRELLLVYEYIPNGTVSSHLHGDQANPASLPWPVRMKIAVETASALAYLHASDIIHRDVKTSNILLDNDFGVKVADFGLSRLFPDDVTHVSTAPRGTPGYVDPDYRLCYQLTTKSDVYSFGVVLVELMSCLKPVDMNREREDIKLANLAVRKIQKGSFFELVDPSLGFESDERLKRVIGSVAELAFRCLQGEKELRPSMGEVLEVLQRIRNGRDEAVNDLEGIVVHADTRASQSYPLPNTLITPPQQRLHKTR